MKVVAIFAALVILHGHNVNAVGWSFATIAENSTGFSSLPAINAKGEVVFLNSTGNVLFVGDGRSLRTVYQEGDFSLRGFGGHPDINASGTIAFIATPGRVSSVTIAVRVHAPRSLKTVTGSPSATPRADASTGWTSTDGTRSALIRRGMFANDELRNECAGGVTSVSGYRAASSGFAAGFSMGAT